MKATKVRELDTNEIAAQLKEQEEQRFRLRLQIGMGQADEETKAKLSPRHIATVVC